MTFSQGYFFWGLNQFGNSRILTTVIDDYHLCGRRYLWHNLGETLQQHLNIGLLVVGWDDNRQDNIHELCDYTNRVQ